ncbi:hypothetical protein PVAND_011550 [Polypedilum vanderplanki]|uniref:Potassium channel domain-containing protein n=1 Tax=Polypedilum vanderplanki TaxID=319348 RepID=A0A9J6CKR6_POLVA|nr:hypothetical protein PVAND_011550 [Polypedilum vanderplanki]
MSPKQWLSLLTFYILYLIFGASVFYHMEHKLETQRRIAANSERIEINALLKKYLINNTEIQEEILDEVSEYCGKPVTHPSKDEYIAPYTWSFYHAFFFSFTVCSTVGYGNIYPTNSAGRLFLIFYGLVGLPVHAILFAYMGNFWGNTFINMYKRYKEYKMSMDSNWVPRKLNLIGRIFLYLIPGIAMFIFAPAMIFSYFEEWDYLVSVYYAFVTLTTIGLGDFVATFQRHQEKTFGTLFIFYQLFILCWFIAGVSYIAMIIGFLIKGLRSKRIKRIEHNLAINIKETQRKIWNGVQKDVGYIRKILNEVYFSKFKPVYKDPDETKKNFRIPRSQSCPHLFMDNDDENEEEEEERNIKYRRERAFSECPKLRQKRQQSFSAMTLHRPQSDTDLSQIDRTKTFDAQRAALEPGELLAKVTIALGGYRVDVADENDDESELGVHGFSDSEILASEQNYSDWSIETSEKSCYIGRNRRALSEVRIPIEESIKTSNEWTWSGANTQISDIEKIRARMSKPKRNLYRASFRKKLRYDSDVVDDFPRESPHTTNGTATNKSMLHRLNPFKRKIPEMMKRHSLAPGQELHPQRYIDRRESINSLSKKNYLSHARASIFSMPCYEEEQDLLETTSVADLIRAIEMFHVDSNAATSTDSLTKRRKMGTDHLSHKSSLLTLFLNKNHDSSHTIHSTPTAENPSQIIKKQRGRLYSCVLENLSSSEHYHNRGKISSDALVRKQSISASHPPPPPYTVKTSQNDSLKSTIKRRFSVRPSNLDKAPGQFHKAQNLPVIPGSTLAQQQQHQQNQISNSNPSPLSFARKLSFRTIPSSLSKANEH